MNTRTLLAAGTILILGMITWLMWPEPAAVIPAVSKPPKLAVEHAKAAARADVRATTARGSNVAAATVLRGRIRHSDGTAVAGMHVWLEYAEEGPNGLRWQYAMPRCSYACTHDAAVTTDTSGAFELHAASLSRPVVVRYHLQGEHCGGVGPYDTRHLPPALIDIIVPSGGRMYGVFKSCDGVPITNAELRLTALVTNSSDDAAAAFILHYEADSNGNYTSYLVPPGRYAVAAAAEGYYPLHTRAPLTVCDGELTLYNAVFDPAPARESRRHAGVVLDWHTQRPIAGVRVTFERKDPRGHVFSDAHGHFSWHAESDYAWFEHPGHVTMACHLDITTTIYLSEGAIVDVYAWAHNGDPYTNIVVQLSGPLGNMWRFGQTLQNKTAAFSYGNYAALSNVPVQFSPMCARVYSHGHIMAYSDAFTPEAGQHTRVDVHVPPMAVLSVTLSAPPDKHGFDIRLYTNAGDTEEELFRHIYDFVGGSNEWCCATVPAGRYTMLVSMPPFSWRTNLVIAAPHTRVHIDVPCDGVITGMVHDTAGQPVNAAAYAYTGLLDEPRTWRTAGSSLNDLPGFFCIKGLHTGSNYFVQVMCTGFSDMWFHAVMPGTAPIMIQLPRSVRIAGAVHDRTDQPLKALVGINNDSRTSCHDEFSIAPVYPGSHIVYIAAAGYAPLRIPVTVGDADIDLGVIVPTERGVSLRGRIPPADGRSCAGWQIYCSENMPTLPQPVPAPYNQSVQSGSDGTFSFLDMPPDTPFFISFNGPSNEYFYIFQPGSTTNVDLGNLTF